MNIAVEEQIPQVCDGVRPKFGAIRCRLSSTLRHVAWRPDRSASCPSDSTLLIASPSRWDCHLELVS